jgi:SAM-dependent methyltransferase
MPVVTQNLKRVVRSRVNGGLWQSPAFQRALPVLDRADEAVRRRRDLAHLPPFSMRVRSNGVEGQFGGRAFSRLGNEVMGSLIQYAGLDANSVVVDIGCGVGRVAIALARQFPDLRYVGLDVDRTSIECNRSNRQLAKFQFEHIDVATDLYNRGGSTSATTYRLPFDDDSVDLVYLISVFTHMYPGECRNYAREILRVLRPSGRCAVTSHVLGGPEPDWTDLDGAYTRYTQTPRKMLGHTQDQVTAFFGLKPDMIVRGTWQESDGLSGPRHGLAQDMLIFTKPC